MNNTVLFFPIIAMILISCEKKSNSDNSILIQKVHYAGCFSSQTKSLKSSQVDLTDSLYYTTNSSTLTLIIDKVYSCCGLLKDSVINKDNVISVYLNDKHQNSFTCNCICLFTIEYSIIHYQQKNIDFKVYIKNMGDNNFSLWKETKFINGLD